MSQPNIQKLLRKAHQMRKVANPDSALLAAGREVALQPSANLLEIMHARNLRETLSQQIVRLEEQSCALSWSIGMTKFDPLYCDADQHPMRDPLNAEEVRSHYLDLLVAVDHLLVQLGDAPRSS